jgi:hypothetical protein
VLLPDIWVFWGEFLLARPKEKELTTKDTKAHEGGPLGGNPRAACARSCMLARPEKFPSSY